MFPQRANSFLLLLKNVYLSFKNKRTPLSYFISTSDKDRACLNIYIYRRERLTQGEGGVYFSFKDYTTELK